MSDKKEMLEKEVKDICNIMEILQKDFQKSLAADDGCIEDYYKMADIIKDTAEAKKEIMMAKYYEELIIAMDDAKYGEDYDENGPMGYNGRRYSSGRYAPAGRGRMMGYDKMPYINREDMPGYDDGSDMIRRMGYETMPGRTDHSAANDRYRDARRYYTQTKSVDHKKKMDSDREDVFAEVKWMLTDIWDDMEPDEKQRRKQTLMQMVQGLPV